MSRCFPWDDLADSYYQGLSSQSDHPAKAMIIKHKLNLSDAETIQQIQDNPYIQYFVGLANYQIEVHIPRR